MPPVVGGGVARVGANGGEERERGSWGDKEVRSMQTLAHGRHMAAMPLVA